MRGALGERVAPASAGRRGACRDFVRSAAAVLTRVLTSSATSAAVSAASTAFFSSGRRRRQSGPRPRSACLVERGERCRRPYGSSLRLRRGSRQLVEVVLERLAESATERAVSPMSSPCSSRKGPTLLSMPLTLSASSACRRRPASTPSSSCPRRRQLRRTVLEPAAALLGVLQAVRQLPEPFFALPRRLEPGRRPRGLQRSRRGGSEKETKILSRKLRDALVEAAARTSEKTVREICPTM